MRRLLSGPLHLAIGALLGGASAVAAIAGFGSAPAADDAGWHSWDTAVTSRIHPYAIAHYLQQGRLPPSISQTREYSSDRDADGRSLDGACGYLISGAPGTARWWSLTTQSTGLSASRANPTLSSDMAVLESDGSLRVTISPAPAAGNWIRPAASGAFALVFTGAVFPASSEHDSAPRLNIKQIGC